MSLDLTTRKLGRVTVESVRLIETNHNAVLEWIPGKSFVEPGGSISGLTVFTPTGREKADYGDWVIRTRAGRFYVDTDECVVEHWGEVTS